MKFFYTAIFTIALPILAIRSWLVNRRSVAAGSRWLERLGFYGERQSANDNSSSKVVWIHAVSVGETVAAVPLVRELLADSLNVDVVLTTTTVTGYQSVKRLLGETVTHVYCPYDLPFAVSRFVNFFRPQLLVLLETELWPSTLAICAERDIPALLVNARLSERSLRKYRWVGNVMKETVRRISIIAAQSEEDAERFALLGAKKDNLVVTGNLKFDHKAPSSIIEQGASLRRRLGDGRRIFILASTRTGEEKVLIEAIRPLQRLIPDILMVVAPRHPERFGEVSNLFEDNGFKVIRHSDSSNSDQNFDVYVVDSMGELPQFYAASDVAFVGGSLLPYGGHNVLEPAALGIPVLTGPNTYNFAGVCKMLEKSGALAVVETTTQLVERAAKLLLDGNERDRVGMISKDLVQAHGGATKKTFMIISEYLQSNSKVYAQSENRSSSIC